jgi:hypothetical protein
MAFASELGTRVELHGRSGRADLIILSRSVFGDLITAGLLVRSESSLSPDFVPTLPN